MYTCKPEQIINCPHNPTGWHPTVVEWGAIVAICEQHGIWLFSDEMYRHLEPANGERPTLPSAAESYSRGVTLSGLSKAYGLAGLRLGWLASSNAGVIERCYELKDYTSICAGTPNECLGLIALRAREALWERCNGIVAANLDLMDRFVQERDEQLEWRRPLAGPVALPRLVNGGAAAHSAAALKEEGVMLIPECEFGTAEERAAMAAEGGGGRVRVGLGRVDFAEKLEAWGRVLDR